MPFDEGRLTYEQQIERYKASRDRIWVPAVLEPVPEAIGRMAQISPTQLPSLEAEYGPFTGKIHTIGNSRIPVKNLLRLICELSGQNEMAIKSGRRDRPAVRARQTLYWLCKHFTPLSLPQIGRRLGGKDHTSVLHGVRRIEEVLEAVKHGKCKRRDGSVFALPKDDLPEQWAKLLLAINPWPYPHTVKH
jgi:hypothetical protein